MICKDSEILNMTEEEFWRCTPGKIFELIDVKRKLRNGDKGDKNNTKEKEWDTVMYAID